jgi:D-serine deaminase-like pyridoxal phosphate-dependent protein
MVKTHKSSYVTNLQRRHGSRGFLAATVAEAEALVEMGVDDVVLAYPPFGVGIRSRIHELAASAQVTVSLDSSAAVEQAIRIAMDLQRPLRALLIVDSGNHRLGVAPTKVVELADRIRQAKNLFLAGVSTHAGHVYGCGSRTEVELVARQEADAVLTASATLRAAGYTCDTVAVGSTPTAQFNADTAGITEIRPGNYVFHDAIQVALGACEEGDCALRILATVLSVPVDGRVVIDVGSKTLSSDRGAHAIELVRGYGIVHGRPATRLERISEELGVVTDQHSPALTAGERLSLIPNHACTVANLTSHMYGVRGDQVEVILPVFARR